MSLGVAEASEGIRHLSWEDELLLIVMGPQPLLSLTADRMIWCAYGASHAPRPGSGRGRGTRVAPSDQTLTQVASPETAPTVAPNLRPSL